MKIDIQAPTIAAAVIAAVIPSASMAGPDRVSILAGSYHLPGKYEALFNETTPGVFLTWESIGGTKFDFSTGIYANSYGDVSTMVSVSRLWEIAPGFELGIFAGAAIYHGIGERFMVSLGDVVPTGGIQARAGNLWLQFIPSDGKFASGIISGGITFEIGEIK